MPHNPQESSQLYELRFDGHPFTVGTLPCLLQKHLALRAGIEIVPLAAAHAARHGYGVGDCTPPTTAQDRSTPSPDPKPLANAQRARERGAGGHGRSPQPDRRRHPRPSLR